VPLSVSLSLSIYQSIYQSIYLSICPSVHLFIYLFIYLSTYLSIYLSIYLWLYSPLLGLGRFFRFMIFYIVSTTPRTMNQPAAMTLPAHKSAQTQNKRKQTYIAQVGFEPTIPVFERMTTVHALNRFSKQHSH
jgi:hypothetical protein